MPEYRSKEGPDDSDLPRFSDDDLASALQEWGSESHDLEVAQFGLIRARFAELNIGIDHDSAFSLPFGDGWLRMLATNKTVDFHSGSDVVEVPGHRIIINRSYTCAGVNDHVDITDYIVSFARDGSIMKRDSRVQYDAVGRIWKCDDHTGPFIRAGRDGRVSFLPGAAYAREMSDYMLSNHDLRSVHMLLAHMAPFSAGMSDPI